MAIRNRKGKTLAADGSIKPKTKRTRTPKGPVIDPPRCSDGPFHKVFPHHLQYKVGKETKNCWFQCEYHMNKHIERYNLDRRKISIRTTKPRSQ